MTDDKFSRRSTFSARFRSLLELSLSFKLTFAICRYRMNMFCYCVIFSCFHLDLIHCNRFWRPCEKHGGKYKMFVCVVCLDSIAWSSDSPRSLALAPSSPCLMYFTGGLVPDIMYSLNFHQSERMLHFLWNQEFKECDCNHSKIFQMEELQFSCARR